MTTSGTGSTVDRTTAPTQPTAPTETAQATQPPVAAEPLERAEPTDLRLVPAAAGAWLAAGWAVGASPTAVLAMAGVTLLSALAVLVWQRRSLIRPRQAADRPRGHPCSGQLGLALLACALVLLSVAGQLAVRSSGLLADLVERRASVRVEAVVSADPRAVKGATSYGGSDDVRRTSEGTRERRVVVPLGVMSVTGRGVTAGARAQILVLGDERWSVLRPGQLVAARGRLVPAEPGDDVMALLMATGGPDVAGGPRAVERHAELLRAGLRDAVQSLPDDSRGLLPGLVVGDTSQLPPDLDEAMRVVGLTHLTAVSGSNVAIVCGTALLLAAACGAGRRTRALLAGIVLCGFVVLARPEPSVLRAAVMGAVGLLGLVSARRGRGMPALGAAVVVLVVVDPWLARTFGFALSVLATCGLLLLARPWAAAISRIVPRPLAQAIAVPAAAQAVCAPVIVLLSPQVSLVAVPANLLVAPAVAPATVLGVAVTVVAPLWADGAQAIAGVAGWATWWISTVARVAASVPGASVPWPGGRSGALLLAVLTIAVVLVLTSIGRASSAHRAPWRSGSIRRHAVAALLCLGLVAALLVLPGSPIRSRLGGSWPPAGWRMVACDVGQGDALVLTTGPASAIVVDTGPEPDPVDACLRRLGVAVVDLLVISHFHADHAGGVRGVLHGRQVRQVLVSPLQEPRDQAEATRRALEEVGASVVEASIGHAGVAGAVTWRVVWPDLGRPPTRVAGEDGEGEGSAVNDASVVMLLEQDGLRLLATGDVEPAAQAPLRRVLLGSGVELPIDVLKVAHHGSSRQERALHDVLAPRLAVVSVGKENDYGHPAPATLELLHRVGALVTRTDQLGDIAVGGHAGSNGAAGLWVTGRDGAPSATASATDRRWSASSVVAVGQRELGVNENRRMSCRSAVAVFAHACGTSEEPVLAGGGTSPGAAGHRRREPSRRPGHRAGAGSAPRAPP